MTTEKSDAHGILTYISEMTTELSELARRTGHEDLVSHLRLVGEAAAQKIRTVVPSDQSPM